MRIAIKQLIPAALIAMGLAGAARAQVESVDDSQVTVITSEKLTFDYKQHFALFEKNVVVNDPDMDLKCDQLTVRFDDKNKVREILANGTVSIVQEDKVATAAKAIYQLTTGEIVLTGSPRVTRGRDVLTGDKITFFREKNLMICEPGATLRIYPEKGVSKENLLGDKKGGRK